MKIYELKLKIYKPKTNKDLEETKLFMTKIVEQEFGYKININWHNDILNLRKVYLNSKSILLVIEYENKIIGTIAGRPYDREYLKFKDRYKSNNTLGLWRHYVDKKYRGKGLGTKLLNKVIKLAGSKGYEYLYLHTQKTIPNSLEYWISKGFDITWDTNDNYETVHLEKVLK